MNESPATEKFIEQLTKALETPGTLAWEQAPLIYKDLLVGGIIDSCVLMLFFPLLLGAWLIIPRVAEKRGWEDEGTGICQTIVGFIGLLALILFGIGLATFLTAIFAPRAYLLGLLH